MNKKTITPNPTQPVDRVLAGQLPTALAELSEETLGSSDGLNALPAGACYDGYSRNYCAYDGEEAE